MSEFWYQVGLEAFGAAVPFLAAIVWFVRNWRKPTASTASKVLIGFLCVFLATLPLNKVGLALLETKLAPVQAMVVRQPVKAMTSDDITEEFVSTVERALLEELTAKAQTIKLTMNGSVVEKNRRRLGVIKVESGGRIPLVTAFTIDDGQLIRVTCGVPDIRDVDYKDMVCKNAMKINLGASLD